MGPPEVSIYPGSVELPFAREPVEGSTRLLVTFPRLRPGAAGPSIGVRRHLDGIDAHRLYLGADEHKFIGPQRRLGG